MAIRTGVLLLMCTAVLNACKGGSPAASEPPTGEYPFAVARSSTVSSSMPSVAASRPSTSA